MPLRCVSLCGQSAKLSYPPSLASPMSALLGGDAGDCSPASPADVMILEAGPDTYAVKAGEEFFVGPVESRLAIDIALDQVIRRLIDAIDDAVVLHAASVAKDGKAVVIAGPTGSGKTSIAGWLVARGFDFLADEIAVVTDRQRISTFPRALLTKSCDHPVIDALRTSVGATPASAGSGMAISIPGSRSQELNTGLIIFPTFDAGSGLRIQPLTRGRTALRLMECNLNARNLGDHGLSALIALADRVPAFRLRYGHFDELENVLDRLVSFLAKQDLTPDGAADMLRAFQGVTEGSHRPSLSTKSPSQTRNGVSAPLRPKPTITPKLTIGMATFDDYDGVYFTTQAMRLYHPEVAGQIEFVVIDNNPDGVASRALRGLERYAPNLRYVPNTEVNGTAVRDFVFEEASGDFVLCVDCHVLLAPGALKGLLDFIERNPLSNDLLQGPLVYDDLGHFASHMAPQWRAGMFGTWAFDPAAADPSAPPFEIPMQGLGLFACRRAAWPGFNRRFRGFGGEEGYIHEKFRQRGGRVLCLPFLRWLHRFNRPLGVPYRNKWEDRIHNYLVGFEEVGWDTATVESHFRELLGLAADHIIREAKAGIAGTLAGFPTAVSA